MVTRQNHYIFDLYTTCRSLGIRRISLFTLFFAAAIYIFAGQLHSSGIFPATIRQSAPYQIVISPNAAPEEKEAAGIMQRYLDSITGEKPPIVMDNAPQKNNEIIIGNNRHLDKIDNTIKNTRLNEDGFVIKSNGAAVILWSKKPKACVYAAYHFLENYLGCRKYSRYVTVIPKKSRITVTAFTDVENPVITYREIYYNEMYDKEYRDWHKLDFFDVGAQSQWGLWGHTMHQLVPVDPYFKTNPEFFALRNNKRIDNGQLCLSNQALADTVIMKLKRLMATKPNAVYWSISPNDNNNYCQCENCRKIDQQEGNPTGAALTFINKIAAAFPDKKFVMLAYKYTFYPPKNLKPLPNVIIEICPIDLLRNLPVTSNANATAGDVQRAVNEWRQKTDNLMVWDYITNYGNFLCPYPNFHILQPNIQYFVDNGVKMFFMEGTNVPVAEFSEVKSYLLAKLLWNPKLNYDALLTDFTNGYYGNGGKYIKTLINSMTENLLSSKTRLLIGDNPVVHMRGYLEPDRLNNYYTLLAQAENAVKGSPDIVKRIGRIKLYLDYAVLEEAKKNKQSNISARAVNFASSTQDVNQLLNNFVSSCKQYGVTKLKEAGVTPDEYKKSF